MEADDVFDVEKRQLDGRTMLVSMLRVVCRLDAALGRPLIDPEGMTEMALGAYDSAFRKVMAHVEADEGGQWQLNDLASMANLQYQEYVQQDPLVRYDQIAEQLRQKWRFLIRHLFNLYAYDSEDDGTVQSHEEQIEAQFRATLEQMALIPQQG